MRRIALACVVWLAACGGEDEHVDRRDAALVFDAPAPIDGAAVDGAIDATDIDAIEIDAPNAAVDSIEIYRAIQVLSGIENRLPQLVANGGGSYPASSVAFTPGATCCTVSGVTMCPQNVTAWQGVPMWDALGVRLTTSHAFVYAATGNATNLLVTARSDLNCDGTVSDITMTCSLTGGISDCQLNLPQIID